MRSKFTTFALLAALAAPLVTLAEKPSTQPSQMAGPMRPFGGKGDPVFGRMGRREGNPPRPSTQEIDETLTFIEKNFPNHFEMFSRLPREGPFRNNVVLPRMVQRYRQLMRMQDQNPEAYDAMLRQAQFEDEALGYARDIKERTAKDPHPDAEVRLKEVVRRMIQRGLDDRRERIERLEKALADQKQKLADDEQNKDQLIADQVDRTQTEFEKMFRGKDRGATFDATDAKDVNALQK